MPWVSNVCRAVRSQAKRAVGFSAALAPNSPASRCTWCRRPHAAARSIGRGYVRRVPAQRTIVAHQVSRVAVGGCSGGGLAPVIDRKRQSSQGGSVEAGPVRRQGGQFGRIVEMETVEDVGIVLRGQRQQAPDAAPILAGQHDRDVGQCLPDVAQHCMLQRCPAGGIVRKDGFVHDLQHRASRIQRPQCRGEASPERDAISVAGRSPGASRADAGRRPLSIPGAGCAGLRRSNHGGYRHVRIDRESHEVEAGGAKIRQCLIAQVGGKDGGIAAGRKPKPAGDIDAAGQDDGSTRRKPAVVAYRAHDGPDGWASEGCASGR